MNNNVRLSPDEVPATSPFAALAQTAPTPATPPPTATGDTSFLDNVSSREPNVKPCIVPGVVADMRVKVAPSSGNSYLSIAVTLFGDKMVYENGDPVSPGKRLTSSFFASAKDEEGLKVVGRKLKNLLLALKDVPLDGKEDAAYSALPATEKIARASFTSLSLSAFEPTDRWTGVKVLVDVRVGKDMDGNPRNEFNLLAASTKPREARAKR